MVFGIAFLAVAVWETFRPKRPLSSAVTHRWSRHGIMLCVCTAVLVGFYRVTPVIVALKVSGSRLGLFNKPWAPLAVRCALAIVLIDLLRYGVHRAYHTFPLLWRVHKVHHSDPDFDLTTGTRVHPFEVIITQGANMAAIAILAAPPAAVLIVELTACMQSFMGHANASLPAWIERPLRLLFVTPDMHRVHHSEEVTEQGRNLGDIFPWWDHLFRTYQSEPAAGQSGIVIGMKGYQNQESLGLAFMLLQPFRSEPLESQLAEQAMASDPLSTNPTS